MANEDHLAILKKGVEEWNEWRKRNPGVPIDLRGADLRRANLRGVDFSKAKLQGADLSTAPLGGATHLMRADLGRANLQGANLSGAYCGAANFRKANLSQAILKRASLFATKLQSVNFGGADVSGVDLTRAYFKANNLSGTNFSDCLMWRTVMVDVDLSSVKGLATVRHRGPSSIGIDTIYLSKGKIPKSFLQGAGVPEEFVEHMNSLVANPTRYYSCFISYSTENQKFADGLNRGLRRRGVRVWLATENLKIGGRFRSDIEAGIGEHEKLLLVLSKQSIESDWVEDEVEAAFEKERREKRIILFPIRLDDSVMQTQEAWAAKIRRERNIGDFRKWKEQNKYKKAFERLLRDLRA